MATVTYDYEPNQSVYVIDECNDGKIAVVPGTVIRVVITALVTQVTTSYDIRLDGSCGTKAFDADNVFVDKTTALSEYSVRLG